MNWRGPLAVRRLRHLLRLHKPLMVFLLETKVDDKRMESIRKKLGYVHGIDVGKRMESIHRKLSYVHGIDASDDGNKGGLCLTWKEVIV